MIEDHVSRTVRVESVELFWLETVFHLEIS